MFLVVKNQGVKNRLAAGKKSRRKKPAFTGKKSRRKKPPCGGLILVFYHITTLKNPFSRVTVATVLNLAVATVIIT